MNVITWKRSGGSRWQIRFDVEHDSGGDGMKKRTSQLQMRTHKFEAILYI